MGSFEVSASSTRCLIAISKPLVSLQFPSPRKQKQNKYYQHQRLHTPKKPHRKMTGKSLTSISLSFILQPSPSHFYSLAANSVAGQGKDSHNLHSKKNFLWKVTNSNSSEWEHRVRADPEGNWYFLQVLPNRISSFGLAFSDSSMKSVLTAAGKHGWEKAGERAVFFHI